MKIDSIHHLNVGALHKLESSQKKGVAKKEKGAKDEQPSGNNIELEVDKMLAEFAKLVPGASINGEDTEDPARPDSQKQIEESFRKLMEEPMGNAEDIDLGELNDMNAIIEQMMAQLTSKDVLYEPFHEMMEKYPGWLEANEGTADPEQLANCRGQLTIAKQVVELFDRPDYEEKRAEYQAQIFELMQGMQEYGAPPEGVLSEAPPAGLDGGEGEGLTEEEKAAMPDCKQM